MLDLDNWLFTPSQLQRSYQGDSLFTLVYNHTLSQVNVHNKTKLLVYTVQVTTQSSGQSSQQDKTTCVQWTMELGQCSWQDKIQCTTGSSGQCSQQDKTLICVQCTTESGQCSQQDKTTLTVLVYSVQGSKVNVHKTKKALLDSTLCPSGQKCFPSVLYNIKWMWFPALQIFYYF